MKEKFKSAAIRALWTFVQTALGIFGTKGIMTGNFTTDVWFILASSLAAAALSFAKSMGIGMPETEELTTDGDLELIASDTNGLATGGVKWNPDFDLAERIATSNNPAIVLGIKKTVQQSEDTYRQIRV